MKGIKEIFEKRRLERRNSKSSGWIQLILKIILFVAVILLIKNLSFTKKDTVQGFLFEQMTPSKNMQESENSEK